MSADGVAQEIELVEREREAAQIMELDRCLAGLKQLAAIFKRVASTEELKAAEGKRCILAISGLRFHTKSYYFQVTGTSIEVVNPYEDYNTLILAPIESVINVLKGLAAGNKWAFSEERARGKAVIRGSHSLHDAYAISEAFKRFAALASRYGPISL